MSAFLPITKAVACYILPGYLIVLLFSFSARIFQIRRLPLLLWPKCRLYISFGCKKTQLT